MAEDVEITDEQKTPTLKDQLLEVANDASAANKDDLSGAQSKRSRSRRNSSNPNPPVADKSLIDALDLNDLLSKDNGSDVEL